MSVTKKDVEYVADLARLELSEEEIEGLRGDLNKVLDYMEKLGSLDTENTEIVVNPYYVENKFREDEVQPSMPLKDTLMNMPKNLEEYLIVPKIIE